MAAAHRRLRRHGLHRAADRRAAGRPGRAPGAGRPLGRRAWRRWPQSLGGLEYVRADVDAQELGLRPRRRRRRAGLHRRAVREVGRARRARGRRRRAAPTWTRPASRSSSGACSRSSGRRRGAPARALLTAMGYDFAPGALAGALALEEAGADAVRVDVGYYALGGGPSSLSAGTRESLVGVTLGDGARLPRRARARPCARPSACAPSRSPASRARRSRSAAPSTSGCRPPIPALREVNVYLGWFGPLARPLQAGSLVGEFVRRVPLAHAAMRFWGERVLGLLAGPERGHHPRRPLLDRGRGVRRRGPPARPRSTSRASTATTSPRRSWPGRRSSRSTGAGALGPVEAYGLERLNAGAGGGPRARP